MYKRITNMFSIKQIKFLMFLLVLVGTAIITSSCNLNSNPMPTSPIIEPYTTNKMEEEDNTQEALDSVRASAIAEIKSIEGYYKYESDPKVSDAFKVAEKAINTATTETINIVKNEQIQLIKTVIEATIKIEKERAKEALDSARTSAIAEIKSIEGYSKYESDPKVRDAFKVAEKDINSASTNELERVKNIQIKIIKETIEAAIKLEKERNQEALDYARESAIIEIKSIEGYTKYESNAKVRDAFKTAKEEINATKLEDVENVKNTHIKLISDIISVQKNIDNALSKKIKEFTSSSNFKEKEMKQFLESDRVVKILEITRTDLENNKEKDYESILEPLKDKLEIAIELSDLENDPLFFLSDSLKNDYDKYKDNEQVKLAYEAVINEENKIIKNAQDVVLFRFCADLPYIVDDETAFTNGSEFKNAQKRLSNSIELEKKTEAARAETIKSIQQIEGYEKYKEQQLVKEATKEAEKQINAAKLENLENVKNTQIKIIKDAIEAIIKIEKERAKEALDSARVSAIAEIKSIDGYSEYESDPKVSDAFKVAKKAINSATIDTLNIVKNEQIKLVKLAIEKMKTIELSLKSKLDNLQVLFSSCCEGGDKFLDSARAKKNN